MEMPIDAYEEAAAKVVELGNQLAEADKEVDLWQVSDGLLAGAIHYWLYSRQPCGDVLCEDCEPISTAELRLAELEKLVRQMAEESDYFHSPTDSNVGRA